MAELKPLPGGYYIWKFVPSIALAVVALLLWLSIAGAISWKMWKTRTWFCTCLVIGAFMEVIGFGARASASNQTDKLMPYIIQNMFILLPPVLFAATIYMCLGRLIRLLQGEHLSLIRPSRLTKVFVSFDILSFFVQGNSAPFSALADKNPIFPKLGQALVLIGLTIQLLSFSAFFVVARKFHNSIKAQPTQASSQVDQSWHKVFRMLYSTSILIIIRSFFRLVEFAMGNDGYLLGNEWPLFVFDTIPMLAVCVLFFTWYPSCLAGVKTKGQSNLCVELESQMFVEGPLSKS